MDITLFFWIKNVERSIAIFSIKSLFISQNLGSYNLFKSIYLVGHNLESQYRCTGFIKHIIITLFNLLFI